MAQWKDDRRETALHEAAHAVVLRMAITPEMGGTVSSPSYPEMLIYTNLLCLG